MKSTITKERENRQHKEYINNLKPYVRFISYMVFGTASLITSAIAAYSAYNYMHLTGWKYYVIGTAIVITLTPAAFAIGRYIIQGAFNAAKEVKE